jgi:hypothetical protein
MEKRQRLDRTKIEEAFRIMGQYLLDRKTLGEIAIYGGSAILFQLDWRRTSFDVDARVTSVGNHGIIMEEVQEAAQRLHLPRSWLNESVTMYARRDEAREDCVFLGLYPSPERFGLRVTAAKPEYILAMKLKALERATADDRDYQDAIGVRTIEGFKGVFRKFFGDEELPFAADLRLMDLVKAVEAELD